MTRRGFDRLAYREPRPSAPIMHALGLVNRWVLLPRVLKLAALDFPEADLARLRPVLGRGSAAFLAPNHPEFMTDWLIDKEVARRASPLMAHWASYEIVNIHPAAQWLWLRNNLIANAPGGNGREYSVRWARAGHGVLLHPEGAPSWHGDRVGPLLPGVVEMAWETRRHGPEPVHIAPIVWKIHFRGDVARGLHREMAHLERRLELPAHESLPLEQRFAELHKSVLARSLERHGGHASGVAGRVPEGEFFAAQEAHADRLLEDLEARHGRAQGDRARRIHGLTRAIHARAGHDAAGSRQDRRVLSEVVRLGHFTRYHYAGPRITQEQIAESLKPIRLALVTGGWRETLHWIAPVAVAPRAVRIRVPDPIAVGGALAASVEETAAKQSLLRTLEERLQGGLDALNAEIAPDVSPYARPNPFHVPG